jgi:peptidyl-prolyl cis-trans isomerase C
MNATLSPAACVNGVPLAVPEEDLSAAELRQRAGVELLRQAAIAEGLLAADDPPPLLGAISEAAGDAIEALLERHVAAAAPDGIGPDDTTCRRWHAANALRFAQGERVQVRHILFAVTPGVNVQRLRERAESCLIGLRARDRAEIERPGDDRFAAAARDSSNCPSGATGGALGWLAAEDCAPEFARGVFGRSEIGVLPELVHSRHGLHIVELLAREGGTVPPYEAVQHAVRRALERQAQATAWRRLVLDCAERAQVVGVDLSAA